MRPNFEMPRRRRRQVELRAAAAIDRSLYQWKVPSLPMEGPGDADRKSYGHWVSPNRGELGVKGLVDDPTIRISSFSIGAEDRCTPFPAFNLMIRSIRHSRRTRLALR